MMPSEILPWLTLALTIIALAGHLKGYFSSGEKKVTEDVSKLTVRTAQLEETAIKHDRRIQAVENEMVHLPDKDSQHRIEVQLERLSGRMDVMAESLSPIKANNQLIRDLLEKQVTK